MGVNEEARAQLISAFKAWDWSPAFPGAYVGVKAPLLVPGWPYDVIDNMLGESKGLMTQPVISLVSAPLSSVIRTLGDRVGPGQGSNQRYGERVEVTFATTCWADQEMGAGDMVEKLAGQLHGCVLVNRNRLAAYRQLRCLTTSEAHRDRLSIWRYDLSIAGFGLVTYDAP